MIALLLAAGLSTVAPCKGFYSYIPADREKEVPFSVEVQPTAISVLYTDYSRVFAERQNRPDGVIQFYDAGPGGVNYWLACSGEDAFLTVDHDDYHPNARVFRLVRTTGDIWAEARKRGWKVEE
jgi:hypothetical protein